jgi:putative nucleotidyltransferase with HDIG domain
LNEHVTRWTEKDSGYFSIKIDALRTDLVTGFDLYLPGHGGREPVLYRESTLPFSEEVRERLSENRIAELLVKSKDRRAWLKYTEQILPNFLADSSVPVVERAGLLYESAQSLVHEILMSPDAGEMVQQSHNTVDSMVGFLFKESTSFYELMQLTSYDYYTYTHSVNVFVYSVSLANRLGLKGKEVTEFGHGALMHDIGKRRIDAAIINSSGRLTEEQWQQMQLHPVHGHKILLEQGEPSQIALDVTRHHHEKLNGRGYPDGLTGNEISHWARISTIADIFDALTTKRSYKDAMDTFIALQFMKEKMWDELDREYFKVFVSMMAKPK